MSSFFWVGTKEFESQRTWEMFALGIETVSFQLSTEGVAQMPRDGKPVFAVCLCSSPLPVLVASAARCSLSQLLHALNMCAAVCLCFCVLSLSFLKDKIIWVL